MQACVVHTPGMHTPQELSAIADGEALSVGGLYWPRPYFPTRSERAGLIGQVIPGWAIPTGATAAWIWTGMGSPTPLAVLRPAKPALSPLARQLWRARELSPARHTVVTVAGQKILDPLSAQNELLRHGSSIDGDATQLLFLRELHGDQRAPTLMRVSGAQRDHVGAVLERMRTLQERYPDITR